MDKSQKEKEEGCVSTFSSDVTFNRVCKNKIKQNGSVTQKINN